MWYLSIFAKQNLIKSITYKILNDAQSIYYHVMVILYLEQSMSCTLSVYFIYTHYLNCILSKWSFKTYSQDANEDKIHICGLHDWLCNQLEQHFSSYIIQSKHTSNLLKMNPSPEFHDFATMLITVKTFFRRPWRQQVSKSFVLNPAIWHQWPRKHSLPCVLHALFWIRSHSMTALAYREFKLKIIL